jgi:hypothetical protein
MMLHLERGSCDASIDELDMNKWVEECSDSHHFILEEWRRPLENYHHLRNFVNP